MTVSLDSDLPRRGKARWARDFAIVGALSSFLAPFLVSGSLLGWPTLIVTAAAGGLTGAVLGALLESAARALAGVLWPLLMLLFLGVGACWGAVVGAIGAAALTAANGAFTRGGTLEVWLFFMGCAAVAGAAQLAWFGVVYLRSERAGQPAWPLLVAAAGTPFLGWAGLHLLPFGLALGRANL